MLTAKQIEAALHQIEHEYDGFGDSRDDLLAVAHAALSAYERVAALRSELVDFMASSYARPQMAIEDVLRKLTEALEGR